MAEAHKFYYVAVSLQLTWHINVAVTGQAHLCVGKHVFNIDSLLGTSSLR